MTTPLFNDSQLPEELDARVRDELRSGEQLLWVGQPRLGRYAKPGYVAFFFGLIPVAFGLFWIATTTIGVVNGGGNFGLFASCSALSALPPLMFGCFLMSVPYYLKQAAKRTCYALTDQRAILWEAKWRGALTVRSYGPEALTKISRMDYSDGCGDLILDEVITRDSDGDKKTTRHGFMAIENVRDVEELLHKVLLSSGGVSNS
jgi:hypothetical protein